MKTLKKEKFKASISHFVERRPYLMVIPAVLAIFVFQIIPFFLGIVMSFLDLKSNTMSTFFSTLRAPFVGFKNYLFFLTAANGTMREALNESVTKTILYVIIVNILSLAAGIIIAVAMNREFKYQKFARCLIMLPFITPGFVIESVVLVFLSKDDGYLNLILVDWLHIMPERIDWILRERAFWVVIATTVWHYFPLFAIFISSGLKNIPREIYEAAQIDGAGPVRRFTNMTLPMLRPIIGVLMFLGTIINVYHSYRVLGEKFYFDARWYFITDYIFRRSYGVWLYGHGAAATIVVTIFVLLVLIIWYMYFGKDMNIKSEGSRKTKNVFAFGKNSNFISDKKSVLRDLYGEIPGFFDRINSRLRLVDKFLKIFEKLKKLYEKRPKLDYFSLLFWPLAMVTGFIHLTSKIGHEGLWYDESYSAGIINQSFYDIITIAGGDSHPPLYFIMLKGFSIFFGKQEASLRLFSVLGVLALALLGAGPVKRVFDKFTGILFGFVTLILPISLSMGQETRMYTWSAFFVTGALLYGYLAMYQEKKRDFLMLSLFTVAAGYTHYYGLLAVFIGNIILFAYTIKMKNKRKLYMFIASGVLSILAFSPWILVLISQINKTSKDFWITSVTPNEIWNAFIYPFGSKFGGNFPFVIPSFAIAVFFIVTGFIYGIKNRDRKGLMSAFCILVYLLTLITAIVVSYIVRPIFVTRYIYPVTGLFTLSMVYGLGKLKYRDFSIIVAILIMMFSFIPYEAINNEYHNVPIKEINSYMKENIQEDDVFIHLDEHSFGIFCYYYPNHKHLFYMDKDFKGYSGYKAFEPVGKTGNEINSFIKDKERIWLVGRVGGTGWNAEAIWYNNGILSYKDRGKVLSGGIYSFNIRQVYPGSYETKELYAKGDLGISFVGVRRGEGTLVVNLFREEDTIFDENGIVEKNVLYTKKVTPVDIDSRVVFEDIPMGHYVAIAFHDTNGNEKLDFKDGMPYEGMGVSNGFLFGNKDIRTSGIRMNYKEVESQVYLYYRYEEN